MPLSHHSLSEREAATLACVLARLIPADESGPGATEAGVINFIDGALAGPMRQQRAGYAEGLTALDRLAQALAGAPFGELAGETQDEVLRAVEALPQDGPGAALRAWFEMVLGDCIDGFLSDPRYGGNAGAAGWRLVGYPGPSLVWTEEEQQLDQRIPPRPGMADGLARPGGMPGSGAPGEPEPPGAANG